MVYLKKKVENCHSIVCAGKFVMYTTKGASHNIAILDSVIFYGYHAEWKHIFLIYFSLFNVDKVSSNIILILKSNRNYKISLLCK